MNIGIYATITPSGGGVYQYTLNVINCLKKLDEKNDYRIFTCKQCGMERFRGGNWKLIYLNSFQYFSLKGLIPKKRASAERLSPARSIHDLLKVRKGDIKNYLIRNILSKSAFDEIDLMIFPTPHSLSYSSGIPFIGAIHDLQHRLQPEFPEVSNNDEREEREILYKNIAQDALAVLVDSETGKEDVVNLYYPSPAKIKVLPYFPPGYLTSDNDKDGSVDVRRKYNLPKKYIFYPAQFWPHKNHLRLISALHLVKTKYHSEINLVMVGSSRVSYSSFDEVMKSAKKLDIEKQIFYLGYVPFEDMPSLYTRAEALVMPTFFGPTNIPILEAFALGCPVITSNIRGVREQVGAAGLLADPKSVEEIAAAIQRLYAEPGLREVLVERGWKKAAAWTEADFAQRLISVVEECKLKLGGIK